MSDYLTRAVERETSPALAVRPALPSRFEPGPPSGIVTEPEMESPIEGEPSLTTPGETEPGVSPLLEPLTAVNALWTAPASAALEQPREGEAAAGKTSAIPDTRIAPATTVAGSTKSLVAQQQPLPGAPAIEPAGKSMAGRPPQPLQPATEAIVRPEERPRTGPTAAPAAPRVVRPAPASPSGRPRVVPAIGEPASSVPAPPPGPAAPGSDEPKSASPPAVAPLTRVVAPAQTTIPRISPAPSSSERARSANHPSSPRPVHITIGRIEVRAVHPPPEPAPRRVAPASPKISLSEYLKKRNGDRR